MASSPNFCHHCGGANRAQATHCSACHNPLHPFSTLSHSAIGNTVIGLLAPACLLHQRYTIVSQVGTGGFGAVYKAKDTLFSNRLVAIKEMIQSGLSPQELAEASAAFQREALLLADLTHPNLPRIHDHFAESGRFYVVMDFIEGGTMEDYLDTVARRLSLEDVLDIGLQLCMALDYLHTHQPPIIFRDVKPANIMRTPNGQVYLIDFGIARHFKPGKAKDTIPLGSRGYAAPEQYGKAQTTPSSDVYGLGATLHQFLTGDDPSLTPFHFESVQVHNSPISSSLNSLLRQMLDMDMSKRPANMDTVKQELHRLLAQQTATQLSPIQKSSLASVRRRSLLIGLVGLVAASAGSSVITGFVYGRLVVPPAAHLHSLMKSIPVPPTSTPPVTNSVSLTTPLYTYRGQKGAVTSVAWSPEGQWIASAAALDDAVQVWDAATGKSIFIDAIDPSITGEKPQQPRVIKVPAAFDTGNQRVDGLAWSPDSTRIALALDNDAVQVNSMEIAASSFTYSGVSGFGNALAWSPDGSRIASVGGTFFVEVWSAMSGEFFFTYPYHSQAVLTLAWSPDGKRIASAGADGTVQVWDAAAEWSRLLTYHGHSQAVSAIAWSPDGKWIASGSADSTVQVWDAATERTLFTYRGHAGGVNAVAWSSQEPSSSSRQERGPRIASGGEDGTVQVWSIAQAANARSAQIALQGKVLVYRGHTAPVLSVTWSSDGRRIASGSEDGTAQVWSAVYKEQP